MAAPRVFLSPDVLMDCVNRLLNPDEMAIYNELMHALTSPDYSSLDSKSRVFRAASGLMTSFLRHELLFRGDQFVTSTLRVICFTAAIHPGLVTVEQASINDNLAILVTMLHENGGGSWARFEGLHTVLGEIHGMSALKVNTSSTTGIFMSESQHLACNFMLATVCNNASLFKTASVGRFSFPSHALEIIRQGIEDLEITPDPRWNSRSHRICMACGWIWKCASVFLRASIDQFIPDAPQGLVPHHHAQQRYDFPFQGRFSLEHWGFWRRRIESLLPEFDGAGMSGNKEVWISLSGTLDAMKKAEGKLHLQM